MKEQSIEAKGWEQLQESLRNVTAKQVIRPYTEKRNWKRPMFTGDEAGESLQKRGRKLERS